VAGVSPHPICMAEQTVTRAIESSVEPRLLYVKLANALLIPQWAPVFAEKVEHVHGTTFRVTKGSDVFDLELIANDSSLTVDYLRDMAGGKRGGAYIRVMPLPSRGSVVSMTVPVGPNAKPDQVATVLQQELEALIKLV
jgi:hypothetical protein